MKKIPPRRKSLSASKQGVFLRKVILNSPGVLTLCSNLQRSNKLSDGTGCVKSGKSQTEPNMAESVGVFDFTSKRISKLGSY